MYSTSDRERGALKLLGSAKQQRNERTKDTLRAKRTNAAVGGWIGWMDIALNAGVYALHTWWVPTTARSLAHSLARWMMREENDRKALGANL